MSLQQLGRERFEVCHKRRRSWISLFRLYDGHSSDEVVVEYALPQCKSQKTPAAHPLAIGEVRTSQATPAQHIPLGWSGLFLFQSVALRTKPIDVVQHAIQQEVAICEGLHTKTSE